MTKIKVCGITNKEDVMECIRLGVDYIGLNFYKKSPRFIALESAKGIIKAVRNKTLQTFFAGVFVNESLAAVKNISGKLSLDLIQLHGNEDPGYVSELKKCLGKKVQVIKAFRVKNKVSLKSIQNYECNYFLFDSYSKYSFGGTGNSFDFNAIKNIKIQRPFFIAGGINVSNIKDALSLNPFGVDINSSVEISPGKKDHKKISEIIAIVRVEK